MTDRCPSCDKDLNEELYDAFGGNDYPTHFEHTCDCGAVLEVEVEAVPIFGVRLKEAKNG